MFKAGNTAIEFLSNALSVPAEKTHSTRRRLSNQAGGRISRKQQTISPPPRGINSESTEAVPNRKVHGLMEIS